MLIMGLLRLRTSRFSGEEWVSVEKESYQVRRRGIEMAFGSLDGSWLRRHLLLAGNGVEFDHTLRRERIR